MSAKRVVSPTRMSKPNAASIQGNERPEAVTARG
jgi:hypothetical protein